MLKELFCYVATSAFGVCRLLNFDLINGLPLAGVLGMRGQKIPYSG